MKPLVTTMLLMMSYNLYAQHITKIDLVSGKSSSYAENLYPTSNKMYFYANDKDSNYSLCSIDTSGFVKQETNRKRAWQRNISYQESIIKIGDTVYFGGFDSVNGPPLWDWVMRDKLWALYPDGSTAKIEDIDSLEDVSIPAYCTELNNKLYFFGFRHYMTQRLFEYDPVSKKITELTKYSWQVSFDDNVYIGLTSYHGRIYFSARNPATGIELYTYDPQADSAWLMADLEPGITGSAPNKFVVYNDKLYFRAVVGGNGYLYEYNDVNNNLQIADTINGGFFVSNTKNRYPVVFRNAFYFPYYDQTLQHYAIANYDSVSKKISSAPVKLFNYEIKELIAYNNNIYFTAFNKNNLNDSRLMVFDGDTTISIVNDTLYNPRDLTVFNGDLYFTAKSASEYGSEMYKFNDTATPPPSTIHNTTYNRLKVIAYPNPTRDIAHLQFTLNRSQTLNVLLTDMNGRVVYQSGKVLYCASTHTIAIPMQNLPAGNYVYQLNDGAGIMAATGKLQKQ